ncbi:CRISPR-associated RAMP Csm3 [Hydrogenimonas sp.]|nr:CRISPR-associated RAMP Csm3 [Hydrogenimonas sp.]
MEIIQLKGQIELLSGLHIGGGDDTMKIGGIDNSVIKDANSGHPYIPGSSLKGKMRSLLEHHLRLVYLPSADGSPFGSRLMDEVPEGVKRDARTLLELFGDPNPESPYGITRISVGDCHLCEESKEMELSEAKFENSINRKGGTALNPRQTERVPAGVKFNYDIRIKVFDGDDREALEKMVETAISLVEKDYLGGNGSRGYGRVRFIPQSE